MLKYFLLIFIIFSIFISFNKLEWVKDVDEQWSSMSMINDDYETYQSIYLNTIRGWFGQSVNIDYVYYIPHGPETVYWDSSRNNSKYYLTVFFKVLPYIFLTILIYLWLIFFKNWEGV